jgi:hypothetical protein
LRLLSFILCAGCAGGTEAPPQEAPPVAAPAVLSAARCEVEPAASADACWAALAATLPHDDPRRADLCGRCAPGSERDLCMVSASEGLVQVDPARAVAICDGVQDALWRAECHFWVLDHAARRLDPVAHARACQERCGQLSGQCISHAADKWIKATWSGGEGAWFTAADLQAQMAALYAATHSRYRIWPAWFHGAAARQAAPDGWEALCAAAPDVFAQRECLSSKMLDRVPAGAPAWGPPDGVAADLAPWWTGAAP